MNYANSLRRLLSRGRPLVAPGVFGPSVAQLAKKAGFKTLYFSGAGFSNFLGLPDLGMTTLTEVANAVHAITKMVDLPILVDADTGFGEAVNVSRTVAELQSAGAAAIHIEDQVTPKRCGHLEGKELVSADEMMKKIITAKRASRGKLVVIARTDARGVEGMDAAVQRALLYARAGAEMIFPEALESRDEFREFRRKVPGHLMANMTEFGKTPYITVNEFGKMGYDLVIFPVTLFRAAMKTLEESLRELKARGTQKNILDWMMTREQVYELIDYHKYEKQDERTMKAARRLRKRA